MPKNAEYLFLYIVEGMDCDGAGYEETWVEYKGFDRLMALNAKHRCQDKAMDGYIRILTPSPTGWRDCRKEKEEKLIQEMEQEAEEYFWLKHADKVLQHPSFNETEDEDPLFENFEYWNEECSWSEEYFML